MKSFKNAQKQGGWTMWGLIIVLGLIIFFGYIIMKLVPVYSQHSNLKNAVEVSFDDSGNLKTMQRSAFIRSLRKQLYIDGSHKAVDYKNDVTFKRGRKGVTVNLDYDRKVPLFYNISLAVDFNESMTRDY